MTKNIKLYYMYTYHVLAFLLRKDSRYIFARQYQTAQSQPKSPLLVFSTYP